MRTIVRTSPDYIDVTAVWQAVRKHGAKIIYAAAAAGLLMFAFLSLLTPKYASEAQLVIVARGAANPFAAPKQDGGAPETVSAAMDKEAVNTHVQALLSSDLAEKVAVELKLEENPEFNSSLHKQSLLRVFYSLMGLPGFRKGETAQERVLQIFSNRLEVYAARESRFIGIRFISADPDLAPKIANKISEVYRETLAQKSVQETGIVQQALEPRIEALTQEVAAAEAEAESFRGTANIFKSGPQGTGLNEQQLGEMTAELSRATAARSETEVRSRSARELMRAGNAGVLPDVQRSPLIQNLVQQRVGLERQISELSATLLSGHPRMRQLSADLAGLKSQIENETGKVVESLEKEAKLAALRETAAKKSLDEVKTRVVETSANEVRLRQLEAVVRSKRAELERMQSQFESNRMRADSRTIPVEAQIISGARPSSVPVSPRKIPHSMLVFAAALMLGLACAVTKALLNETRSKSLALTSCKSPVLGEVRANVNKVSQSPGTPADLPLNETQIMRFFSIPKLTDFLRASAPVQGSYRLLLTTDNGSPEFWSNVVEIAAGLARDNAQSIVIDFDLAGQGISSAIGAASVSGMTELLNGTATFDDVIEHLPGTAAAHFIACGASLDRQSRRFDPDHINLVLDALDEVYDDIIVAARYDCARELFEVTEGRFDAGVMAGSRVNGVSGINDMPGTFLGFEVAGITLARYERAAQHRNVLRKSKRVRTAAEMRAG